MLDAALQFLADQLNSHLIMRTGANTVEVKPSQLVDESGKYSFEPGTIGAAIINIEEERALKSHLPGSTLMDGQQVLLEPELKLNLHVMFAANFQKYDVALKYLSLVLTYFQSHPAFTTDNQPTLDPRIGKLTVELQSLTYEQLNQIWAFIGGKLLPSIVYKVRMVTLQDETPKTVQPPITQIKSDIRNR